MKKNTPLLVIVGIIAVLVIYVFTAYNSLVSKEAEVDSQWATVESKLQRRYDLIPNLVNSVEGSMKQEKEVFGNIADARSKMAGANTVKETSEASAQMETALSRLLVVMENYPELKSNENVNTLMTQLEGTENRISVERDRYNKAVKEYNVSIKKFPKSLVANMTGFNQKDYFEAADGAEKAPEVKFNN
ncbi:LemA family protein [Vagococcus sp. DIV0080]|mgnify:CR=1 FL=1|uniref:LemA family protein n=1 Tax=Candidatus Vagococcus giribetii TaxID=2230876 RepID=A0ABS3HV32_9ENTE|nr:LemA family protein [Vagococcus sp. DIV0080]MBO0477622.1 LemA family protein [Vagococcus sp. DIV0080]